VRLRRLQAVVFGPHRDRDLVFDGRLSLLYGPNESGKSSFRAAIETLFYGFEPARRETHPLANWDDRREEDLHLEAELAYDDGTVQRVERTLPARTIPSRASAAATRRCRSSPTCRASSSRPSTPSSSIS